MNGFAYLRAINNMKWAILFFILGIIGLLLKICILEPDKVPVAAICNSVSGLSFFCMLVSLYEAVTDYIIYRRSRQ